MKEEKKYPPAMQAFMRQALGASELTKEEQLAEKAARDAKEAEENEARRQAALPFCLRNPLPEVLSEVPMFMDKVRAFFLYHPSGDLLCAWREPNERGRIITKRRGVHGKGYVEFWGMQAPSDDVVWLIHHGRWPKTKLQHIDGDWRNDRIENLREPDAIHTGVFGMGRTPSRGVARSGPYHWQAYVKINGVQKNLGRFKSEEEALARRAAWDRGEDLV